ncbi:alpha-galactosidase [Pseudahrensia aquimaris]|uniref:alpha-galactosidase n=1 Tax=Pseudahrensia aquimaris TaxID=744461 RepID=A0ABW3FDM7_9HYPH
MGAVYTHRLDSEATTILFGWTEGVPEIIYFGSRLSDDLDLEMFARSRSRPRGHATLDEHAPISMQPEISRGFMGHPGLIAHRRGSVQAGWAGQFLFSRMSEIDGGVEFRCYDQHRGLVLEITCRLCSHSGVAVFKNKLMNDGESDIVVDWMSAPIIPVPQLYSEYLHFHGRWCAEFHIDRRAVPMGLVKSENRRGRTSHEAFPGTVMLTPTTDEESGRCLGVHMGWSGNHRMVLERMTTGECQLQMGVLHFSREGIVPKGGTILSPEIYVAQSDHGLNDMSQKFHAYVRENVLRFPDPNKPRPVTVNTWEALYFDHDLDRLKALADAAQEVGAERYVLDDGWFKGRNDDTTSLGDWYPDEKKYPNGLHPIVDYVVDKKGMEFGLWVEPEMVNPDSDLYRAHPDWILRVDPYPSMTGRNQFVLDLTNTEVTDYLYERLSSLLSEYRISYFKWDMNRDLVLPGDRSGNAAVHRQTSELYRLIDRLRAAFPHVEIESCASGGGRIDYEILKRTHRFWTSDSNDAVERTRIQTGFSYFLPPEVMGSHIGPAWCHTSGRGFHPHFRALVASYGHMGLELDLTKIDPDDMAIFKNAVERYKQDRGLWHGGAFHRIDTVDADLLGAAVVSADQRSARVVMMQIDRPRAVVPPAIAIPGLDPELNYAVTLQTPDHVALHASRKFDNPLLDGKLVLSGSVLSAAGVQLPVLYAQTGVALAVEAV